MVAMLLIEIPLIMIITSQQYEVAMYSGVQSKGDSLIDFWFLRFPFEIHGGWITVATILNLNIIFVAAKTSTATQLAITMLSFGLLLMGLVFALFVPKRRPRFTIAFVFAWAMVRDRRCFIVFMPNSKCNDVLTVFFILSHKYAVQAGMQSPASSIVIQFSPLIITSVQYCANIIYISILVIILLKFLFICCLKTNEVVDSARASGLDQLDSLLLDEEAPLLRNAV